MNSKPLLFSFRRCPYAIRARMTLHYSKIIVDTIEVDLKNKPSSLLAISPKGTVPVLQLPDQVIDESRAIMTWALGIEDPKQWLGQNMHENQLINQLINNNDQAFKPLVDKYKYPNKYPDENQDTIRLHLAKELKKLDQQLQQANYLAAKRVTIADIAIMPFVRQAYKVQDNWFMQLGLTALSNWLEHLVSKQYFIAAMQKLT